MEINQAHPPRWILAYIKLNKSISIQSYININLGIYSFMVQELFLDISAIVMAFFQSLGFLVNDLAGL